MGKYWLIECPSQNPCPMYVEDQGKLTCDPWQAKRFVHLEQAQGWLEKADFGVKPVFVPHVFQKSNPILRLKPNLMSQFLEGVIA